MQQVSRRARIKAIKRDNAASLAKAKGIGRATVAANLSLVNAQIDESGVDAAGGWNLQFEAAIHASHTLKKVHSHPEALYCTRCGAYNNGGPLRTLKAKCSGVLAPAHASQHRLLECGIMPAPGARLPNSSRKGSRVKW